MVHKMLKKVGIGLLGIFWVLSIVLSSITSALAGTRTEKPLFLSYEQRLVMTYVLAGAGESNKKQMEIADRFEKTFEKYNALEAKQIDVTNFAEFLKAYQGPWPQSYSLESDMSLIEKGQLRGPVVIRGMTAAGLPNVKLQEQINGFINHQHRELQKKAQQDPSYSQLTDMTINTDALIAAATKGKITKGQKRTWILQGFSKASDMLKSQMKMIQQTGEVMSASGKMESQDPVTSLFLGTVIKEYFGRLGLSSQKQIISQFLGNDLNADSQKKFELMVMNSGPQFQKLLQVVARDAGISEELLKTFKQLESKANPIPAAIVKDLFEAERERYQWINYETSALGTGTMAQVHKGQIETSGGPKDVVIRFLKPEIEKRVKEDYRILSEIAPIMDADPRFKKAGLPKMAPVVSDLNKTVTDELDLEATKDRQRIGKEVYTRELMFKGQGYKNIIEVSVPGIYDGRSGDSKGSKLMVQDLVIGTKLDKEAAYYQESIPDLKKVIIEQVTKMWVEEMLFKSGFFHSDMHQGNFMVQVTDPAINLAVLDFGMGGVVSKQMQMDILTLGAGLELNRADIIAEMMWSLSDKESNQVSKEKFTEAVYQRIEKIKSGKMDYQGFDQWSTWAMDFGIRFPYTFIALNRGLVILDKSLKDAGSTETASSLGKGIARSSVGKVLGALRSRGMLSWMDLVKLGWVASPIGTSASQESATIRTGSVSTSLSSKVRCAKIHTTVRGAGGIFEGPALMLFDGLLSL